MLVQFDLQAAINGLVPCHAGKSAKGGGDDTHMKMGFPLRPCPAMACVLVGVIRNIKRMWLTGVGEFVVDPLSVSHAKRAKMKRYVPSPERHPQPGSGMLPRDALKAQ